jgi:hypothetical protein
MKLAAAALLLAASLAVPATAHAECGDPGQDPCTGPVPTVDQVVALLSELMDPNRPNEDKNDVVTPDLSPESIGYLDTYLDGRLNAHGDFPYDFVVTDIQPAPNNLRQRRPSLIRGGAPYFSATWNNTSARAAGRESRGE